MLKANIKTVDGSNYYTPNIQDKFIGLAAGFFHNGQAHVAVLVK